MAYDTKELETLALQALEEHQLTTVDELVSYLPCSQSTFYNHKMEQLDSIKKAMNHNRVSVKVQMKKEWRHSENATLQISLYKLLSTEDELARLNRQDIKQDVTTKGKEITGMKIV